MGDFGLCLARSDDQHPHFLGQRLHLRSSLLAADFPGRAWTMADFRAVGVRAGVVDRIPHRVAAGSANRENPTCVFVVKGGRGFDVEMPI